MAITDKLTDIANAVRVRNHSNQKVQLSALPALIKAIPMGLPIQVSCRISKYGEFIRPEGWADLDNMTFGSNEVYMVIDNSGRIDDAHLSMICATSNNSAITYEIGYIVGNTFTATESKTVNSASEYYRLFTEADNKYPVVHIKANANINRMYVTAKTINGKSYVNRYNAIVERCGHIYTNDSANYAWGTYFLEKERIVYDYAEKTYLSNTWNYCYSLQSLDLSGWDTSGWAVTSLQSTWNYCYSLQSLDLSGWDTTKFTGYNWERITYLCRAMRKLNVSAFDIGKVTQWGSSSYPIMVGNMLEEFTCGTHNYNKFKPTTYTQLRLSDAKQISHKALMEIVNMLGQVTTPHTLNLSSEIANRLTTEEKAIVTAKGWTIA